MCLTSRQRADECPEPKHNKNHAVASVPPTDHPQQADTDQEYEPTPPYSQPSTDTDQDIYADNDGVVLRGNGDEDHAGTRVGEGDDDECEDQSAGRISCSSTVPRVMSTQDRTHLLDPAVSQTPDTMPNATDTQHGSTSQPYIVPHVPHSSIGPPSSPHIVPHPSDLLARAETSYCIILD